VTDSADAVAEEHDMTASLTGPHEGAPHSTARALTLAMAAVFLVVGVVGFFLTGLDGFFDHHTGEHLLWFEINPAHNIVHLLFGLLGLALVRRPRGAEMFGWILGLGYLGALVYGLIAIDETWDFLSVNAADNWLHLVLALAGFAIVVVARIERTAHLPQRGERPAAGPGQTAADLTSSLPPGGAPNTDLSERHDVDRAEPYDEEPMGLRIEDLDSPRSER
jgi:hypothetical protein